METDNTNAAIQQQEAEVGQQAVNIPPEQLKVMMQQQENLSRVMQSGSVNYYTQYDKVISFMAGALMRGLNHIGKVTENTPVAVLEGRKTIINEEVNEELMGLLNKIIENGGVSSLEQKAEMLDHICDSIFVLLGLAANMGLPFDVGFDIVHNNNMSKILRKEGPIFREPDGKVLKPAEWRSPEKKLWEVCYRLYKLEMESDPAKQTNLPEPKIIVPATTEKIIPPVGEA